MKRFIWFALVALLVFLTVTLISCSDKKEPVQDNTEDKQNTEGENYKDMFLQTREDCEYYFFSYYAREGFGSYSFAYPSAWVEAFAAENGMDRKTLDDKIENGCAEMATSRAAFYGENYVIDWENTKDEKIEGEALEALKNSLADYDVSPDTVLGAVRAHYTLSYYENDSTENLISEANFDIILLNIAEDGWTVSPENYMPVEF
jgi:hypothetical protein